MIGFSRCRSKVVVTFLAIVFSVAFHVHAQSPQEYVVRFRDGSVISMALPDHLIQWQSVSDEGRITPLALPLAEVEQLELVLSPVTERVRNVRSLIDELGHKDYQVREHASRELLSQAGPFLSVIEASRGSQDPEVNWRLEVVYQTLRNVGDAPVAPSYDRLQLSPETTRQVSPGIAGDWQVLGTYRGYEIPLSRENVKSISRGPVPDVASLAEARMGERLDERDIAGLPEDRVHIDFDTNSKGEDLERGTAINDEYVGRGVQLGTNIEDGFVGVFSYSVPGSLSKKNSAGGQWSKDGERDYKGITTIKFCVPGQPDVPAGVHYFGCFLSIVVKDGTLLRFFDGRGHLISEQLTDNSRDEQTDFVGFYSPIPIARVEIHPTVIDGNYAFDDLLFDPPESLVVDGVQSRLTVVTHAGEKVEGKGWAIERAGVKFSALTVGEIQAEYRRDEVAALIQHFYDSDTSANPTSLWGRASNGSVLRLTVVESALVPELSVATRLGIDEFTCLWSGYVFEPDKALESIPAESQFPLQQNEGRVESVNRLGLKTQGWEIEEADGTLSDYTSGTLPTVFVRPAPQIPPGQGRLLTVDEQLLVIDGSWISLVDWDASGVTLRLGEEPLVLRWNQVRYLRFPEEDVARDR